MECRHVKGFKHMLLNACNEDNNPVSIGLPDGFRRLNAAHTLHLYIKKDNVKFSASASSSSPVAKSLVLKSGFLFFMKPLICSLITSSSSTTAIFKIHHLRFCFCHHLIYRHVFCYFEMEGTKGIRNGTKSIYAEKKFQ